MEKQRRQPSTGARISIIPWLYVDEKCRSKRRARAGTLNKRVKRGHEVEKRRKGRKVWLL